MEEFEDVLKKEVTEFIVKHPHWSTGEVIASTYVGFHMVNVVMDKLQNTSSNSDYAKSLELTAMAIVNRINENVGTSVPVRQSTNDVNFEETIAMLKQLSSDFA